MTGNFIKVNELSSIGNYECDNIYVITYIVLVYIFIYLL